MVMLIAGGSLSTGSHDPYCGTRMPLGPSTPSVGLRFPAEYGKAVRLPSDLFLAAIVPLSGAIAADIGPM